MSPRQVVVGQDWVSSGKPWPQSASCHPPASVDLASSLRHVASVFQGHDTGQGGGSSPPGWQGPSSPRRVVLTSSCCRRVSLSPEWTNGGHHPLPWGPARNTIPLARGPARKGTAAVPWVRASSQPGHFKAQCAVRQRSASTWGEGFFSVCWGLTQERWRLSAG